MSTFELSAAELRTYRGSSPIPADLDAYWDRALSELEGCSLDWTSNPAEFHAPGVDCRDMWFTGLGGARIHARLAQPAAPAGKGPGLLMFHGYHCAANDWFDMLPYVYAGFTVAGLDVRGQGGVSEDNLTVLGNTLDGHVLRGAFDPDPDKLFFRFVYLDTVQLARILMAMEHVDPDRIGATGFSQGGGLTLACAALEPRIRAAVPGAPFLTDFKRVYDMDIAMPGASSAYREFFFYFTQTDPFHEHAAELWERLGYIDVANLAPRIRASTYMYTGLMDTSCPPCTQFAAFNRITAPKKLMLAPNFAHEPSPGFADRRFTFLTETLL